MPSIFDHSPSTTTSPKIHVSHSSIPSSYLDPSQPPTKCIPFRQVRSLPFLQDVKVCMPSRVWWRLFGSLPLPNTATPAADTVLTKNPYGIKYARFKTTLSEILNNHSLRAGKNILLSLPSSPAANSTTITLNHGKLTLDLLNHIYERTGLQGQSPAVNVTKVSGGGRKHEATTTRWRVEIDLRAPGMVRGKKGFDRVMYAARNVDELKERRVWSVAGEAIDAFVGQQGGKKRKRDEGDGATGDYSQAASVAGATAVATTTVLASDSGAMAGTGDGFIEASTTNDKTSNPSAASFFTSHQPKIYPTRTQRPTTLPSTPIPHTISNPSLLATLHSRIRAASARSSKGTLPDILEEDIHELVEYLSLLFLRSPFVKDRDWGGLGGEKVAEDDVTTVEYNGLMGSEFVVQALVEVISRSRGRGDRKRKQTGSGSSGEEEAAKAGDGKEGEHESLWAAISVKAHRTDVRSGSDGYVILLQGGDIAGDEDGAIKRTSQISTDTHSPKVEAGTDDMGADSVAGVSKTKSNEEQQSSKDGFNYVTCFEFVDSLIQ